MNASSASAPLAALTALLLLSGCADIASEGAPLRTWTLEAAGQSQSIELPTHIDGGMDGLLAPTDQTYSLRRDVELPKDLRGRPLTLGINALAARASLLVDGVRVETRHGYGVERLRSPGTHVFRIPATLTRQPRISLELRVQHRWAPSAWIDSAPSLTATNDGLHPAEHVRAVNEITQIGGLIALWLTALMYTLVWALDRRQKAHGWFASQALLVAVHPMFALGLTQPLFGRWETVGLAVSLIGGLVVSVFYTASLFEMPRPSRAWGYATAAFFVYCAVFHDPFIASQACAPVVIAFAAVGIFYQVGVLLRLARRDEWRVFAMLHLASWLPILCIIWTDMLPWLGLGDFSHGYRLLCVGYGNYALWQAVALSYSHSRTLQREGDLSRELALRVEQLEREDKEVRFLNEELRRQVASRSEQMSEALARLGSMAGTAKELSPGDLVDQRYEVLSRVGEGGAGIVYAARRVRDGRRVALKTFRGAIQPVALARFAKEANLASQLNHPNVIGVLDVGIAVEGFVFLIMQLVSGRSVREMEDSFGDAPWAIPILAEVATGVAAMHERGVIHRDLKPGNILLRESGEDNGARVKIADFGIARLMEEDEEAEADGESRGSRRPGAPGEANENESITLDVGSSPERRKQQTPPPSSSSLGSPSLEAHRMLTQTGHLMGTPRYMAPELAEGAHAASPASDVFSFGVMAYEMLMGRPPYMHHPVYMAMGGHPIDRPEPIEDPSGTIDAEVLVLLETCLETDAQDRPSAQLLADTLARFLGDPQLAGTATRGTGTDGSPSA